MKFKLNQFVLTTLLSALLIGVAAFELNKDVVTDSAPQNSPEVEVIETFPMDDRFSLSTRVSSPTLLDDILDGIEAQTEQ